MLSTVPRWVQVKKVAEVNRARILHAQTGASSAKAKHTAPVPRHSGLSWVTAPIPPRHAARTATSLWSAAGPAPAPLRPGLPSAARSLGFHLHALHTPGQAQLVLPVPLCPSPKLSQQPPARSPSHARVTFHSGTATSPADGPVTSDTGADLAGTSS